MNIWYHDHSFFAFTLATATLYHHILFMRRACFPNMPAGRGRRQHPAPGYGYAEGFADGQYPGVVPDIFVMPQQPRHRHSFNKHARIFCGIRKNEAGICRKTL
jgi:hypothetical protein